MISLKIGVIADTHAAKELGKLEKVVGKYLSEVDLIIHAGDFVSMEAVKLLEGSNRLLSVWGNNDHPEIKALFGECQVIELNGYKLGLFHGHGEKGTTIERVLSKFKDIPVDIIIFGHSHQPSIMTKNNVLILNPGSPTNKRRERWFSLIILTLEKQGLDVQLRLFTDLDETDFKE